MSKKLMAAIALMIVITIVTVKAANKKDVAEVATDKKVFDVKVQTANDSKSAVQQFSYPAQIIGDQEVNVVAKSNGIAKNVYFSIGQGVSNGKLLVKIDDSANNLSIGNDGFVSSQIQIGDLALEQAKDAYDAAKKAYDTTKNNPASTSAQISAAKAARDAADMQYKNAKIGFRSSLDSHLITSPIAGIVTKKNINEGDAVSMGQPIATISKSNAVKIQFFVEEQTLALIKPGFEIKVKSNNGEEVSALVRNISPSADAATKKFLVEAYPNKEFVGKLSAGTIADAIFSLTKTPKLTSSYIIPLSAVMIGQNGNSIFISENGIAKKVSVKINEVNGELAEISADLNADAQIIVSGNKMIHEGDQINITE